MLPGHGQPGGKEIYAQDREYLSAARRLVAEATSEEQLKAALIQRFSDYWGEIMLDIQNMYLFPPHTRSLAFTNAAYFGHDVDELPPCLMADRRDESTRMRDLVSRCPRGPRSGADVACEVLAGEGGAGGD
jgi:hypothetical protein